MASKFLSLLKENPYNVVSQESSEPLDLVKSYLDSVIGTYKSIDTDGGNKTSIDEITTEGLDANQVWWQAKMVIDNIEGDLMERIQDLKDVVNNEDKDMSEEESGETGEEENSIQNVSEDEEVGDIDNMVDDYDAMVEEEQNSKSDDFEDAKESVTEIVSENEESTEQDKDGLNDKFFNIEEFNRQSLAQEEGNLEEDNEDDDDDDIDYFADIPSEDDEEAVYYDDFFDKPTSSGKKNIKSKQKKDLDEEGDEEENEEDNYESAMSSLKRDLFEDDDDFEDEENIEGANENKLSTYERQQLEIQKQIQQLEEEAVAEKKWALKGEVKAKDRPDDALLTEDLEFDRNAKPVPVITSDITESLEDMIRKRIHDYDFDDLQKRTAIDVSKKKYKSDFELSDVKSAKSLAEIYEDDYKGVQEDTEISEELQKSHDEIAELFASLTYKLDALSSAHFIPRPSQKSLEVRVDTAAITMEDAQPLSMSSASTLAPQEIYKVGKADNDNEIRLKDGTTMARDELTREDKTRLRRAAKRKRSKQHAAQIRPPKKSKKDSVIETLSHAKNLTVINQKGEKQDIRGNTKRNASANNLKNVKL